MGAAWIHGIDGNPIQEIVKDYGIVTIPTPVDPSDSKDQEQYKFYDVNGKSVSKSQIIEMWEMYNNDFYEYLGKRHDSLKGPNDDISIKKVKEEFIKKEKMSGQSEYAFEHTVNWWMDQQWATDQPNIGLWLSYYINGEFPGNQTIFPNGYNQTLQKFNGIKNIRFNQVVNKIVSHDNGVTVYTTNGQQFNADDVIVTVPIGVLKSSLSAIHRDGDIIFSPPLPDWKKEAIMKMDMGVYHKTYMAFEKQFWENDNDYWWISRMSNGGTDWTTFINLCKVACDPPWLVALNSGAYAVYLETLSESEVANQAMRSLRTIYGQDAPDPTDVITTYWDSDPYARGSYSYPGIGADEVHYDDLARPYGNIHFAGEATCKNYPATIHGAYLSGIREANDILGIRSWEGDLCSMECSPQSESEEGCDEKSKETYEPEEITPVHEDILSPLQQMKNGVLPQDVICRSDKQLLLRIIDDSAICVNPTSAENLITRGIAIRT
jgi:predicted NAD/FAD-dependent oxidoreductase